MSIGRARACSTGQSRSTIVTLRCFTNETFPFEDLLLLVINLKASLSIWYFIRIISNMWLWMILTFWSSHTSHNVPEWPLIIIMTVSSLCLTESIFWKCFCFTHVKSTNGFQCNGIMIINECSFSQTKQITMDRMNSFLEVKIGI